MLRVQALPAERRWLSVPVNIVACYRVTDVRHVNAYLMRSSRFKLQPQVCVIGVVRYHRVMGDSFTAVFRSNAHLFAVSLAPAYRSIHRPALFYAPADYRLIFPAETVGSYLFSESLMRRIALCDDKQTARIHIYPVDYPRTQFTVYPRKAAAAVIHQRIHESSAVMPVSRVYYHAFRLVHN